MAYDSRSDRILLFGGHTGGSLFTVVNDTWAYDYNTNAWTNLNPPVSPSPRAEHAMAYDSRSDRIILFGGGTADYPYFSDETWSYDVDTNTWTNLSSFAAPAARIYHAIAFDVLSDRVVLFGGFSTELRATNDTWAYEYNTNTWTNLSPTVSPYPRTDHAMAYDSRADRIILFGGGIDVRQVDNETWAYDPNANIWVEIHPATAPPPRSGHSMAYDAGSDRIIMFGGSVYGTADPAETWSYHARAPSPSIPLPLLAASVAATVVLALVVLLFWYWRTKGRKTEGSGPDQGHPPDAQRRGDPPRSRVRG